MMTITKKSILKLLETSSQCHILVVGDIMLDEFHWCKVSRISPEAPVPICKINNTTLAAGGAANVAANLSSLHVNVDIAGFIGKDSTGEKLNDVLKSQHIQTKGLIETNQPTTLKSRIIAHHQHVARVDREAPSSYSPTDQKKLISFIQSHISHYNIIILSDYLKGVLNSSTTKKIIELATKNNSPIIIDPKGDTYSKYKNATYITPNFNEFCEATQKKHSSESSIQTSGKTLLTKLNIQQLIITRSEKGITLINNKDTMHLPTKAKEVFDITGAGDTVIACIALGLSLGLSVPHAAQLANIAAGIVVSKLGTATVTLEELISETKHESFSIS